MDNAGLRPGFLGSCVVDGKVTDLLDTSYWLKQGQADWFETPVVVGTRPRVLVAEDSDFFRNLIVPAIMAAGYDVTTVNNGRDALRLRDAGESFDLIISDIHMPELDGVGLARAVREGGAWAELPMIALSSATSPSDVERGRAAGFSDYIAKFDRDALLASLQHCLQPMLAR
jgi:two-component system chemotaxis sensor kinase CheA